MDFITELPISNSYNAILVIVDKLTKYGLFIPVHLTDTASDTAKTVFQHVIAHYALLSGVAPKDRIERAWG